ncbi:hypothetical protein [Siphonobacter curvatus]|uniref:3-keto-disaccharide hydrolase domain-containing protein n=1 Tax=Siphonobacter curvatus TaxID=2094562 RepID=A0A2S7IHX5_9BACT|nr:hypothetical protein [Siphonobacter curvatus]PQA55159.1 hypothetical protein C5O19_21570 [Siphonobacter curvatus]
MAQPSKPLKKTTGSLSIPMEASYWMFDSSKVEFITHRGVKAVRSKNQAPYQIFLKNPSFAEGTIEFDVELTGIGFPGINFRMSADQKQGENFYIRSFGRVPPELRTTLQYAPIVDGISLWDLYDDYQTGAVIYQQGWNHVRLVISGQRMMVFVNDRAKPSLYIPRLEASSAQGGISLSGNVIYANVKIDPNPPTGQWGQTDYNPLATDTRYVRNWQVHGPIDFPFGKDIIYPLPSMYGTLNRSDIPDSTASWESIQADARAMVNLSNRYGGVPNDNRRLAWLKTTIHSDHAQQKIVHLGFSDEVWLFVNGQIVYVDKNYFGTPNAKNDGRCNLENAQVLLSLKPGKNEIMIGLANYFYGWGLIARWSDMNGIQGIKN